MAIFGDQDLGRYTFNDTEEWRWRWTGYLATRTDTMCGLKLLYDPEGSVVDVGCPEGLVFLLAQWGRGGSGPVRVGDEQRMMTTGTRLFRHSVPLVYRFWVGRPEDVESVPLAVLALDGS
ncbi:hypothetical protein AVEN_134204-1 [Araneus ventricosus]|uniref:Uncharacterized protein n=1 Tax=Araneus ventricosus TaxID=182803 RepID=A0A4Y2EPR3_ARAVE|nr:hypothetical protein AVEN_134204-1 [Araneus ventricosus]